MTTDPTPPTAEQRSIPLGPFDLLEPVGRGGMGEVWRGTHRDQGVQVAVKVMMGEHAREPSYVAAFRNEVQSVAALDHPGIIMVFDQGQITEEAEAATGGTLVAGSPYLAMEFCSLGSLERFPRPLGWRHLKALLLSLLEALGHAHARGVIHRDIKPENVLLAAPSDPRPGVKLSDFGLAHPAEKAQRSDDEGGVAGTPLYMSPEQAMGHWRDYGPWTDLYSLGCLAWELTTGCPPFVGRTALATLTAQLQNAPPALEPMAPVPSGFEAWVVRLLEKEARRRFRRAADAAWALIELGDLPDEDPDVLTAADPRPHTDTLDPADLSARFEALSWYEGRTPQHEEPALSFTADALVARTLDKLPSDVALLRLEREAPAEDWATAAREALTVGAAGSDHWIEVPDRSRPSGAGEDRVLWPGGDSPPLPSDWTGRATKTTEMRLVGAGLGLYGLRTLPLVDREPERHVVWRALRRVVADDSARAVFIRGRAGTGKTHLTRAFAQRAHETGASTILTAVHGPNGGPADGLPHMLARHLGCLALDRTALLERTSRLLRGQGVSDPYEWQALSEIIRPSDPDQGPIGPGTAPRFASPIQRFLVIQRLLGRISNRRPLLIILDDVQWGAEALAFADYLLGEQEENPLPALLVLGLRHDALDDRPLEREQIARTLRHESRCDVLDIGPLEPAYRSELVQELLGLEGPLAAQVEKRTGGNPLFAVQLVGDWVERGVLQVGRTGFELKPGERAVLPDDIHQLWTARIERLVVELARVEDDPEAASSGIDALTLAAALGQIVDAVEWQIACRAAGIPVPGSLIYELVTRNLAYSTELGWAFGHAMLRESLERRAREHDQWSTFHRAIAEMLRRRYPVGLEGLNERLARHLVEAGDLEEALAPLLEAARERFDRSEFTLAHALLDRREEVLKQLETAPGMRPWCEGWVVRSRITATEEQRLEDALVSAQEAARAARENGYDDLLPRALSCIGRVVERRGHLAQATNIFKRALPLFEANDDLEGQATCLDRLGAIALQGGHRVRAREDFEQAQALWALANDPSGQAGNLLRLGYVALANGRYDRAARRFQRAYELFELLGSQLGLAAALNALAETARARGDLDGAEVDYRGALERYEAVGSGRAVYPRINLCLVLVARSRYQEARSQVESLLEVCLQRGQRALLPALHCLMLVCAGGEQDWKTWDEHIEPADRLLRETGLVEKDDAWSAQMAGELAARKGEPSRAREAFQIALRLWQELGHDRRAQEIWAQMHQL